MFNGDLNTLFVGPRARTAEEREKWRREIARDVVERHLRRKVVFPDEQRTYATEVAERIRARLAREAREERRWRPKPRRRSWLSRLLEKLLGLLGIW
jgi:hypothetical protein